MNVRQRTWEVIEGTQPDDTASRILASSVPQSSRFWASGCLRCQQGFWGRGLLKLCGTQRRVLRHVRTAGRGFDNRWDSGSSDESK